MTHFMKHKGEKLEKALERFQVRNSYIWAGVIAVVIVAWILSGMLTRGSASGQNLNAADQTQQKTLVAVRAQVSNAKSHTTDIVIRGRTEAWRTVTVRAETVGTVVNVPVEEGSIVHQGDLLCELSMNAREARRQEAEANLRQRKLEYDVSRKLTEQGHRSETQEAAAEAAYNVAEAGLERIKVEIRQTKIRAPFTGILDDRAVEIGDYMRPGEACATVVDESRYLVVGQVSENEVNALHVGDAGTARLIDGTVLSGMIRFISQRADPATRTFRIELEIPHPESTIRDGVTSEIRVPKNAFNAHRLAPSVLVLNAEGLIGVRTVNEDQIVKFMPVTIISDEPKGIWVTGLPDRVKVITVGQEYVSDNQKVNVTLENKDAQS